MDITKSTSKQATKRASYRPSSCFDAPARSQLLPSVELSIDEHQSWLNACFEHAQNESAGDQGRVAAAKRHASSSCAKSKRDETEPDARAKPLATHIGWNFEDDVGNEEQRQGDVESIACKIGVFSDTKNCCVGHVAPINLSHQVDYDSQRQNAAVKLVAEVLLNGDLSFIVNGFGCVDDLLFGCLDVDSHFCITFSRPEWVHGVEGCQCSVRCLRNARSRIRGVFRPVLYTHWRATTGSIFVKDSPCTSVGRFWGFSGHPKTYSFGAPGHTASSEHPSTGRLHISLVSKGENTARHEVPVCPCLNKTFPYPRLLVLPFTLITTRTDPPCTTHLPTITT